MRGQEPSSTASGSMPRCQGGGGAGLAGPSGLARALPRGEQEAGEGKTRQRAEMARKLIATNRRETGSRIWGQARA